MKGLIEEYGQTILYVIIGLALIGVLWLYTINHLPEEENTSNATNITVVRDNGLSRSSLPTLNLERKVRVRQGDTFDAHRYILEATDSSGKDITSLVTIYDAERVETDKKGVYIVTYVVKDSDGLVAREELSVLVD